MTNPERCSCGAREKSKCSKESTPFIGVQSGKMCFKDYQEPLGEEFDQVIEENFWELVLR